MTQSLSITTAQINPTVGDIRANAAKIRKVWGQVKDSDLIVLPELALSGYAPEDLILKPNFINVLEREVHILVDASQSLDAALVLTTPARIDGRLHNVAYLIEQGRIKATILKHHLPNYGVFDEERIFKPGPLPSPIDFRGHRLGIMICEDMWYPDCAAKLKEEGAELLIVPNASPYEVGKQDIRLRIARERVAETGLPLVYVNQCGGQDDVVFDGASFVLNEGGNLIVQAPDFVEDSHTVRWEKPAGGRHYMCLTDRQTPQRAPLDSIYQALMTGLRDYVLKNGFRGVLLGLSGGIDSALTAAIAVDALGRDMVHCVMMPSCFTSRDSLDDADEIAGILGVTYDTIPIEQPVETFNQLLAPHLNAQTPSITYENIQSRSRAVLLMALSNATGFMVLSTGNKSEMAVGYATLYGDMCGGFNVLKDLYKTQVFALSRYRNETHPDHALGPRGLTIPERIIAKPPTAELKAGQTDQDTLPPYDQLDDILYGLIEQDLGIEDIAARGHDPATVTRIWRMLDSAEYKRRQSPPGVKITPRAFGRDRRYPITNKFAKLLS